MSYILTVLCFFSSFSSSLFHSYHHFHLVCQCSFLHFHLVWVTFPTQQCEYTSKWAWPSLLLLLNEHVGCGAFHFHHQPASNLLYRSLVAFWCTIHLFPHCQCGLHLLTPASDPMHRSLALQMHHILVSTSFSSTMTPCHSSLLHPTM